MTALTEAEHVRQADPLHVRPLLSRLGRLRPLRGDDLARQFRHTALMDYSYKLAVEAHETGMPMVRPMFLPFPDDESCWREWDQFFYGDEILVAPVWKSYQRLKMVYLPQGRWTYYWSGKTYEGPRTLIMHTPLDRIPIFTPEGSEPLPPPEELGR